LLPYQHIGQKLTCVLAALPPSLYWAETTLPFFNFSEW
jgi:hypothetical protein